MDLEPALEALSLVEDPAAGRRLDLICLDVPEHQEDEQVESIKRKIKRSRRKHLTPVTSPNHPDRQTVASLSLSEDLTVSRTTSVVESVSSSKPEEDEIPDVPRIPEDIVSPSPLFSEFFWPQVSFEQPANGNGQASVIEICDQNDSKDKICEFSSPLR
jgi:hypothetical protein